MKKILILFYVLIFFQTSYTQTKTGTTVGQFLLIEPSARVSAMGNAGSSLYGEVSAAYYNPGAIGMLSGYQVQFTHSLWLADIAYNYAAVSIQPGDWGNLFASVTSLNSGEIEVRTVSQPLGTGERYTVSNFAVGLGYGKQISDRFSAGVQVTYMQEMIWHSSLSAFAINVGTIYRLSPDGLHIGASISNFGTRAKYSGDDLRIQFDRDPTRYGDNSALPGQFFTEEFPLPVFFRVGVSMPWQIGNYHKFQFAVDAFHPNDNTESISFGGEWMFRNTFAIRGGYQNLFQQDSEVGLTLGAGLYFDVGGYEFKMDYAWNDYGRLESVQRFTVGLSF